MRQQFDKMDKTNMYMRDDTIYFVIPTADTKPVKVVFDKDSIEENPFLQELIDF